jgi:CheY-like chemotaxis protein
MPIDAKTQALERRHKELLFARRLPDAVLAPGAPAFLRLLDLSFARELLSGDGPWGGEDAFDERSRLIQDVLSVSPEARQLVLAAEVDLLTRVGEAGADFCHRGAFDLLEWVFPLRLRGHVVHLVRSGKFREQPFLDAELKEMAHLSGVPLARVQEAARALPILPPAIPAPLRALRDARQAALTEHLRAREAGLQQMSSERLVALGTMAEGAAQHLNNLLSIVLGYTSLLADKPGLAGEPADLLRKASEAAQRGRRFTEELLALAGGSEEDASVLSLHERLQGVLSLLQSRLVGRIKLDAQLNAAHDRVLAPPGVFHQILFNLLTNALDGMPAGGVLTVGTRNARSASGPEEVVLEISDTGGQGPSGPSRKSGKAGQTLSSLGEVPPRLTSTFGLVASLEGDIEVVPDDGFTTRVVIKLPVTEKASAGQPARKMRRRLAPSSIWVADDDEVMREMCRRVLAEDGHRVEQAASGGELLKRLATAPEKPDLIVYDFSMPDLDGFEICTRLRKEGVRTPVLLVSGFKVDQPEVQATLKLRKTFFLQKPFSFREMADMVTVAMGETLIEE